MGSGMSCKMLLAVRGCWLQGAAAGAGRRVSGAAVPRGRLLANGGGADHQVDAHAQQHHEEACPSDQALRAQLVGLACGGWNGGGGGVVRGRIV